MKPLSPDHSPTSNPERSSQTAVGRPQLRAVRRSACRKTCVVVIGGGQAGLSMSASLAEQGIDHVVLERGRVGERWHSERWDSLRLLTPNWMTRMPRFDYAGGDPHGFMTAAQFARRLGGYARSFAAPVQEQTTVLSVRSNERGYRVQTDQGELQARAVVIATGDAARARVPALAQALPGSIQQLTPSTYKRPSDVPEGGVLIVGASASGAQLAAELSAAGRNVTLAVGRHLRMPRRYRDRDIMWWLDRMGLLNQRVEDVADAAAARRVPSYQLVGDPNARALDLGTLQAQGVTLCGHLEALDGPRARFDASLSTHVEHADDKLVRLLDRIDAFAVASGLQREVGAPDRPARIDVGRAPLRMHLEHAGIRSVIWATGYTRSYPWLQVEGALGRNGQLLHEGGVMQPAGMYALGLRFMRRRSSSFIDGVGRDARELSIHVAEQLGAQPRPRAQQVRPSARSTRFFSLDAVSAALELPHTRYSFAG